MFLLVPSLTYQSVVLEHVLGPTYSRTTNEAACGRHIFKAISRNGPSTRPAPGRPNGDIGTVESITVDSKPVPGAAEGLQLRVAGRSIQGIGVMNCGYGGATPVFSGVVETSALATKQIGFTSSAIYFRLDKDGRSGWKITYDQIVR